MGGLSVPVAIALGSNLGDRRAMLDLVVARLTRWLHDPRVSSYLETAPVGVDPQPDFLNAVLVGYSAEDPLTWIERLLSLETELGRERPYSGAPRVVDLDLILCGNAIVSTPRLTLPHPRFRERRFVLEPLASVAPNLIDPVTGETVAGLLARLGSNHSAR